jgi:hypothetical protein
MRLRLPRYLAILLLLGLLALGAVVHVHGPDGRMAAAECSLCASVGLAVAAGPSVAVPAVALAGKAEFAAPVSARHAVRCASPSIRGPPVSSPA